MGMFFLKKIEYFFKILRSNLSSDLKYKSRKFKNDFGFYPDLINPRGFNEKIIKRIIFDNNPIHTNLADKVTARKYVESTIGSEYLVPLIGVYTQFNHINTEQLPSRFVMKCSHDSGSCIICLDKKKFDFKKAKKNIEISLSQNMYVKTRERHYREIPPRIICEKYMDVYINKCRDNTPELYRVHCFDSNPSFIEVDFTDTSGKEYINIYDNKWKLLDVTVGYPNLRVSISKPSNLKKLLALSASLSREFDYCRIDWFMINDKFYFSEYTFTPCAGRMNFNPMKYNYIFGDLWIIKLTP